MPISAFVTPASADTTTIAPLSARVAMIRPVRAIASASPTDVPPNLRTITSRRCSPQCTISSALSTDAPAAPRMTLCPIATSFTSKIGSGRMRPTTTVMPLPVFDLSPRLRLIRLGCEAAAHARAQLGSCRADSAPRHSAIARSTSSALACDRQPDRHAHGVAVLDRHAIGVRAHRKVGARGPSPLSA